MSELAFDSVVCALSALLFWRTPLRLLVLVIVTMPYIAGNYVGELLLRYSPQRGFAFALVFVVICQGRFKRLDPRLKSAVFVLIAWFAISTIGGLVWLPTEDLAKWRQTPTERAIRSALNDALFWLLPLASICVVRSLDQTRRVLRSALLSGVCYASLGVLQLIVGLVSGVDLFPVSRQDVITGELLSQPLSGIGLNTRLTSLCGEPRYFSAFAGIWLILALFFDRQLKLSRMHRVLSILLFSTCLVFSGSKTGLFLSSAAIVVGLSGEALRARWRMSTAVITVAVVCGTFVLWGMFGMSLALFERANLHRDLTAFEAQGALVVGTWLVPLEPHDIEALRLLQEKAWPHVIGFGSGLWQYHSATLANPFVVAMYRLDEGATLGSFKVNIGMLGLYLNYGVVGLCLLLNVLVWLYRGRILCRVHLDRFGKNRTFWTMIVAVQLGRSAEVYANVLLLVLLVSCAVPHWLERKQGPARHKEAQLRSAVNGPSSLVRVC